MVVGLEGCLRVANLRIGGGPDLENRDVETKVFAGKRVVGVDHARFIAHLEDRQRTAKRIAD